MQFHYVEVFSISFFNITDFLPKSVDFDKN